MARSSGIVSICAIVLFGSGAAGSWADERESSTADAVEKAAEKVVDKKAAASPAARLKAAAETGRYIVLFEEPPLAGYRGDLPTLQATSPAATGQDRLNANSPAAVAYLNHLQQLQDQAIARMSSELGRSVQVYHRYRVALNGVVVAASEAEARRLLDMPGVWKVLPDELHAPTTDIGPGWIGAGAIWNNANSELETMGEDVVVGVLDTGINPEHSSFAAVDPTDGYQHRNPNGTGSFLGVCDPDNTEIHQNDFPCNDKLIGAWFFLDNWDSPGDAPRDEDGHGTHVTSTAAGNQVTTVTSGIRRNISGVAPRANIIAYRVCGGPDMQCAASDSAAGVEQAILDGVDVLNFSIGGGESPYQDAVSLAFLYAMEAGVFVAAAGGNDGPSAQTVSHRGPWMTTVAATTIARIIGHAVSVTGPGTPPSSLQQLTGAPSTGPDFDNDVAAEIRYADMVDPGNADGCSSFPAGVFDSAIALILRGECFFSTKADNAAAAGAVAMIVFNNVAGAPITMGGLQDSAIPAVMVSLADGEALIIWIEAHPDDATVLIDATEQFFPDKTAGDRVADFSGRGPGGVHTPEGIVEDILKPSLGAPGVDIFAASAATESETESFAHRQGTSMASPHVAGAGALLRGLHPGWSPMEIQSALMSTAVQDILNHDGGPAQPFDVGSGRIDVERAARAGLVLDEGLTNFLAAHPGIGSVELTALNIASLAAGNCNDTCSWHRSFTSTLDTNANWSISIAGDGGLALEADRSSVSVPAGGSFTVTVTADPGSVSAGQWAFGRLILTETTDQAPPVLLPVTVTDSELSNGESGTNLSGTAGSETFLFIDTTPNATVTVTMTGGTGDADLFVRFGARPTTETFDCAPLLSGNEETCELESHNAGRYHVMIRGFEAYSGVSLMVSYLGPPGEVSGLEVIPEPGQANLGWREPDNAGSAITDYIIQFSTDHGVTWTTFDDGISTETAAAVTDLEEGDHLFRVAAVNGEGTGPFPGSPVTAFVEAACPDSICGSWYRGWRLAIPKEGRP